MPQYTAKEIAKIVAMNKDDVEKDDSAELAREQVRQQLRNGLLEDQYIEIDVQEQINHALHST